MIHTQLPICKSRRCESSRVTSPLALHDFIFFSNKLLNIISRASLLALAKSIYYSRANETHFHKQVCVLGLIFESECFWNTEVAD